MARTRHIFLIEAHCGISIYSIIHLKIIGFNHKMLSLYDPLPMYNAEMLRARSALCLQLNSELIY